jgi:hypothetical protein
VELDVRQPFLLAAGGGEIVIDRPARCIAIKLEHALMDVMESRYAPGERGPGPHVHKQHDDGFYVLEG